MEEKRSDGIGNDGIKHKEHYRTLPNDEYDKKICV